MDEPMLFALAIFVFARMSGVIPAMAGDGEHTSVAANPKRFVWCGVAIFVAGCAAFAVGVLGFCNLDLPQSAFKAAFFPAIALICWGLTVMVIPLIERLLPLYLAAVNRVCGWIAAAVSHLV
jgi:hypothetical protein